MAPRRMIRRRRRALLRRYKTPKTTQYFRCRIDLLSAIAKVAANVAYRWESLESSIYSVNNHLILNDTFKNLCNQYSYVRVKSISYLAYPDIRNQSLTSTGYVALTVWPRGFSEGYGTWEKCVDNPYFKILNFIQPTYKYCNLLGGDNEWRATSGDRFTWASFYVVTTFLGSVAVDDAPKWIVKISVDCVFKSPIQ